MDFCVRACVRACVGCMCAMGMHVISFCWRQVLSTCFMKTIFQSCLWHFTYVWRFYIYSYNALYILFKKTKQLTSCPWSFRGIHTSG